MRRPVDAPLTQDFGAGATAGVQANSDPNSGMGYYVWLYGNYQPDGHTGQDYGAKAGSPVYAVTSGTVLHVGRLSGTYASNPWWVLPSFAGYCYVIDHGSFIGIYGHCADGGARVSKGDWVSEGQVIGLSGSTGASVAAHHHFEILRNGFVLNSRYYGRSDPEELFGALSYAGETTNTPQEDELSAADVQAINAHTTAMLNAIALDGISGQRDRGGLADLADKFDEVYAWLRGGENGVRNAGVIPAMLATIQGQNAGLLAALTQIGKGSVDLAAVTAAAKAGAEEALSELQATATTTVTIEGK